MKNSTFQHMRTGRGLALFLITLFLLPAFEVSAQDYLWGNGVGSADYDAGNFIAVDDQGNVYTTGSFQGTVDFDPGAGTTELISKEEGNDIFISKTDADGNFLWAKSMGGTENDVGQSLALDDQGNIYITGYFDKTVDFDPGEETAELTSAGGLDIFISKFDTDGNFVWAKGMGGLGTDFARSVAVDDQGNVYTTGYFNDTADFNPGAETLELKSEGELDIFISKLSATGEFVWAKRMGGAENNTGTSLAIDRDGNVYTAGYFNGTADFNPDPDQTVELTSKGNNDIFISKLDVDGDYVWVKNMGGVDSDFARSIAVDDQSNVYTTGYFEGIVNFDPDAGTAELTSAGDKDIFICKLGVDGNFLWAKGIGGIAGDFAYSIVVDDQSNVYTTGYFENTVNFDLDAGTAELTSVGGRDIFISKLDVDGNFVWAKSMGGTASDRGNSIVVDRQGNVYTTGFFNETVDFDPGTGTAELKSAGGDDIFIVKYCQTPTTPEFTVTQTTCDVATGTITVASQYADETYSFDNGATFQTDNFKSGLAEGAYEVIIMSASGCSSIATQTAVDAQPITPDKPEITSNTDDPEVYVLTSSNVSGNQWYLNENPIDQATNASLKVTVAGEYSVQTTLGDCTSEFSDIFSIRNQTITFEAIDDQVMEAGTLTLGATASSGLDVSYQIASGAATIEGDVVTFTGLGMVTVLASQAGSENFFEAVDVQQSFEVVTVTGTEKDLTTTISFYPNPVSNYIIVQSKDKLERVEVLDMSGKQMIVEYNEQLDISQLKIGNYLLKVITSSEISVHQFIKQ